MKHSYTPECDCTRCQREAARRGTQRDRSIPEVMNDWTRSRNPRRARVAREYWDRYESGASMSSDDY